MAGPGVSAATYFGKVPSRGDFIKGGGHARLIHMLDAWVSQAMERMSEDPRWKIVYDNAPQLSFAFVGARSPLAIAGHLRPSHDASTRRFPFLAAAAIDRDDHLLFQCAPLSFTRLWSRFRGVVDRACAADDPSVVLREVSDIDCGEEIRLGMVGDPLGQFTRTRTLHCLADLLVSPLRPIDVRRIILAFGLLLRPLRSHGKLTIEKDLSVPLPADPMYRDLVAALWLYLVSAFVRHTDSELQVLVGGIKGHERMVIGFNGASPHTLLNLLSPATVGEANIMLDDPEWVEDHHDLRDDHGVARLSSYLARPAITLETVVLTFREVFLGE
jgi:type VI secretion system protein ImpM